MISLIPLSHVDQVWPHLSEGMKEACRRGGGDLTPDWLFAVCRKGDALLFVAHDDLVIQAGLVCRVETWSGQRVLRILAACGWDMDQWLPAVREYREWLRNLDISRVVFEGRRGWQRAIPQARVLRQVYEVNIDER